MGPARSAAVRPRLRPAVASMALVAVALVAGACGGGGGGESETPPAAPGANVDPNATGVVGGSINKAKAVAEDSADRDAQMEQQGTTP
jgi:hypothetical protein